MLFNRTHSCTSQLSSEECKKRLVGDRIKIHNLDFEAVEDEQTISIFPHAEQETEIKTLPITRVNFRNENGGLKVVITSKIRPLDLGVPQLTMIACTLLFITSVILYFVFKEDTLHLAAYIVFGVCAAIFIFFWVRMQNGYFDYVRKVRGHVVSKLN